METSAAITMAEVKDLNFILSMNDHEHAGIANMISMTVRSPTAPATNITKNMIM